MVPIISIGSKGPRDATRACCKANIWGANASKKKTTKNNVKEEIKIKNWQKR